MCRQCKNDARLKEKKKSDLEKLVSSASNSLFKLIYNHQFIIRLENSGSQLTTSEI